MTITIATWNCFQGTDRKVPALLDRFEPDIAVVPESSATPAVAEPSLLGTPVRHHWTGDYEPKGLGMFLPGARESTLATVDPLDGKHSLAVEAVLQSGLPCTVLGVWTVPLKRTGHPTPYMGALSNILEGHREGLTTQRMVVAGDFNCSAQADPDTFPSYLAGICDRFGLKSAYHTFTGEAVGEERQPTLWWRSKRDAPYHCDFVLVPQSWDVHDVVVGSYEEWGDRTSPVKSDHAPVVVKTSPAS